MSVSAGFLDLVSESLAEVGGVSVRRMFGGAGLYHDGMMFALVADDILYFKADDATRGAFEAEGLGPFIFEGKGKSARMSYWRVPDRLLEDPEELTAWARAAIGAARRSHGRRGPARAGNRASRG